MKDTELLPLTKRQQQIFDFILECMVTNGAPPTRVEIADNFGFRSPNAAEDHLKALDKKGHIELRSGTSRGIYISESARLSSMFEGSIFNGSMFNGSMLNNDMPELGNSNGMAVIGDVAAGAQAARPAGALCRYGPPGAWGWRPDRGAHASAAAH